MDFRRLFSTTLRFKQNIDFLVHHLFAEFGEIVFTGLGTAQQRLGVVRRPFGGVC